LIKSICRIILFSAFIGSCLTGVTDRCLADELGVPVCPDLHQHEAVLRDGEKYFYQSRESHRDYEAQGPRTTEGGAYLDDRFRMLSAAASDEKQLAKQIASLRFDSEDTLPEANRMADYCLFLGRFPEAYNIEKQVLTSYDSGSIHATPDHLADAVRTMIRCKLIIGCENTDTVRRYSGLGMFFRLNPPESSEDPTYGPSFETIILTNLILQIQHKHHDNVSWGEALSLNKRLNQLNVSKPTRDDLACLIALLLEWNNQIAEAHNTLLSMDEINPSKFAQYAIISFCQRNDDFEVLRHLESKLVPQPQEDLVAILRLYLDKERCEEASKIFRKLVSGYGASSQSTQGVVLYAIYDSIRCLGDSDKPILENFLATELEQNYSFDYEWIDIILTEGEKKWKDFPLETYRDYTQPKRKQTPEPLRLFASFFASNGDHTLSLEAQNAVLGSIDRTTKIWNNLDQRFAALAEAKKDLSAPWVMQSEQGKNLRQKVEHSLSEIAAEHEKRECLAVAAKLDETASNLESRDLFAKAEEMHRESLGIKTKNLGPKNAEILSSLNGLARTLSMQKKYKEADTVYHKALALYRANKQFQDRSYASALESYAQMLASAGQKVKADKIYEDARTFYRAHE
jgi:tetratricopeptide (TPR) repeat protein